MKVLLTKMFAETDIAYLQAGLDESITLFTPDQYSENGIIDVIDDADVILGGLLSPAIIERSAHLKFAQIPWTGVDNLDFQAIEKNKLTVCNSHSNASVVAEHAISLWFSLAKKIPYHDAQMRMGNWNRLSKDGNVVSPFSAGLFCKNIVFIGYGAISESIHQLLSGFSPQVTAVTKSGMVREGLSVQSYKPKDITKAVGKADIVFVCVPRTKATVDLIDQSVFDAMPEHSFLVNVSRGAIVSEQALFESLKKGVIAGAGIDTWYENPKPNEIRSFPSSKYNFHKLNNIVMSPHRAGYIDSGFPHLDDAIENLNRANRGLTLINVVSTSNNY